MVAGELNFADEASYDHRTTNVTEKVLKTVGRTEVYARDEGTARSCS